MKILIFVALLLTSCAGLPPASSLGPPPTNPEAAIIAKMSGLLRDPESARYQFVGGPVPGRAQQPILQGGRTVEGWGYCYLINAKNGFGGYTGNTPYYFVFRGDTVVGAATTPMLSSWNCFS